LCQQVFDCDQSGYVRADRLSKLSAGSEQDLVAFRPARLHHLGVFGIEAPVAQGHLNDAAEPRGVERNLLEPRIRAGARERAMDVLFPEPPEPQDLV
jgi:hypothetical protein